MRLGLLGAHPEGYRQVWDIALDRLKIHRASEAGTDGPSVA